MVPDRRCRDIDEGYVKITDRTKISSNREGMDQFRRR